LPFESLVSFPAGPCPNAVPGSNASAIRRLNFDQLIFTVAGTQALTVKAVSSNLAAILALRSRLRREHQGKG